MKTLLLGLGNTILGDDGVGIAVTREIRRRCSNRNDLTIKESALSGLALLDLIIGYDRLIVVDAIKTGTKPPGYVHRLDMSDIRQTTLASSPHFTGLPSVIEFGRACGYQMPRDVQLLAIEARDLYTVKEALTPELKKAVPGIAQQIHELI